MLLKGLTHTQVYINAIGAGQLSSRGGKELHTAQNHLPVRKSTGLEIAVHSIQNTEQT